MKIEPQEYLQKLINVYQVQCNQYLQERISLQAQLDLVLVEIEKLETKLLELEFKGLENNEVVDVHQNSNT